MMITGTATEVLQNSGQPPRSRHDEEQLFDQAVALLNLYARDTLNEINRDLLLSAGEVSATGVTPPAAGRRS